MGKFSKIAVVLVIVAASGFVACAKDPAKESGATVDAHNEFADPSTLGYFSLPAEDSQNLVNIPDIATGSYLLTMIQSFTVSHPMKVSAAFEQKFSNPGSPRVGDEIRFQNFKNEKNLSVKYRIAAQLNLPLDLNVQAGALKLGNIKEYWNQVLSTDEREWALNSKANATAINPSIDDTLKHPTKKKGLYVSSPHKGIRNTVYVAIENTKLYIYLKTQLKNETSYVRLEYILNQPPAPAIVAAAPLAEVSQVPVATAAISPSESLMVFQKAAFESLGLSLELETFPGGEGSPSLFGSEGSASAAATGDDLREVELQEIRLLMEVISKSEKVKILLKEKKIDFIRIINPYGSKTSPGVQVQEPGRAVLSLEIKMNEQRIIDALETSAS